MTAMRDIVAALEAAGQVVRAPEASPVLSGVTDDSRRITPGALFCAVTGSARDGHAFLADAARRGAAAAMRRGLAPGRLQRACRRRRGEELLAFPHPHSR